MIKKLIIIITILYILALTGCDDDYGKQANTIASNGITPFITIYGSNCSEIPFFTYAVDENTGVVYILGRYGYKGFMSVALNADGTPVTKEQLDGRVHHLGS